MNRELINRVDRENDYEAFCLLMEDFNNRKEEIYRRAFDSSKQDLREKSGFLSSVKKAIYEFTHIELVM